VADRQDQEPVQIAYRSDRCVRRKYVSCSVLETPEGYALALDGQRMRTPVGAPLVLQSRALAEAIATEWNAVGEKAEIKPAQMPMTRLAATAIDRVVPQRDAVVSDISAYGRAD